MEGPIDEASPVEFRKPCWEWPKPGATSVKQWCDDSISSASGGPSYADHCPGRCPAPPVLATPETSPIRSWTCTWRSADAAASKACPRHRAIRWPGDSRPTVTQSLRASPPIRTRRLLQAASAPPPLWTSFRSTIPCPTSSSSIAFPGAPSAGHGCQWPSTWQPAASSLFSLAWSAPVRPPWRCWPAASCCPNATGWRTSSWTLTGP